MKRYYKLEAERDAEAEAQRQKGRIVMLLEDDYKNYKFRYGFSVELPTVYIVEKNGSERQVVDISINGQMAQLLLVKLPKINVGFDKAWELAEWVCGHGHGRYKWPKTEYAKVRQDWPFR